MKTGGLGIEAAGIQPIVDPCFGWRSAFAALVFMKTARKFIAKERRMRLIGNILLQSIQWLLQGPEV